MNNSFWVSIYFFIFLISCTDPNVIGLDFQSPSDQIIIRDSDSILDFSITIESEDSLRSDEAANFVLGEINDPIFGYNVGSFITQILLPNSNIDLGEGVIIADSVVLSYTYSGYYGDLNTINSIDVVEIQEGISKDSTYYSNSFIVVPGALNWVESFSVTSDTSSPMIKINLDKSVGQSILDLSENDYLVDNATFLEHFKGLGVYAHAQNTMLYLNASGSNSKFSIYYHEAANPDSVLTLNFIIDGDAARVNLFNNKTSLLNNFPDTNKTFIQSMAGYKAKISLNNLDILRDTLIGKAINKVTISFTSVDNEIYAAHDKLFLVRVNENGETVFLTDYTIEGESHFGGNLEGDIFSFNITRYFHRLLTNSNYTNELYLLSAGGVVNANRTILDNQQIELTILYSDL